MASRTRPSFLRALAAFLATISLAAGLLLGSALPASAVLTRPFTPIFTTNTTGDIMLRGNSLLTCSAGAACTTAQGGGAGQNNSFVMTNIDVDTDATTFNSSSATITVPPGATVLYAGLSWGASTSAGNNGSAALNPAAKDRVLLRVPGGAYATVTSSQTDVSSFYQGFADVTSTVALAGSGSYTVANVQAGTGEDRYAGWSLAIAYRDPTAPPRNLVIYTGFGTVRSSDATLPIAVSGFTTPASGAVVTRLGLVAYEGDKGNVGDQVLLGGSALSDSKNPVNDVMNSTLSDVGTLVTDRSPAYGNTLGFDIDRLDATGKLANGATDTTITVTTSNDSYYPGLLTFATNLYAPQVTATKSVVDVNGGDVAPGDLLTYQINATSRSGDAATNVVLTDAVPSGSSYVPGTLTVAGTAVTDQSGDDQGQVVGTSVTARLGAGATSTAGGTLITSTTTSATFQVRVSSAATDGTAVNNAALLSYNSQATGAALTGSSNTVTSVVVVPPALTFTPPPGGRVDTSYSDQLSRTGGTGPFVWSLSAGALPPGLTLSSSTGLLSGTPTSVGSSTFTVRIVDANGRSDTRSATLVVTQASSSLALTTSSAATRFGTAVTLTAPAGPGSPTGTVTFTNVASSGADSGAVTTLGTAPLVDGVASLSVAMPAFGRNTVTARYDGDGGHASATSSPVTVEVSGYAGELIVTEFRSSGPAGSGDSYAELYNTGPAIPLAGFVLVSTSGGSVTLPSSAGDLGAQRSYLVTGADFSLGDVAHADSVGVLGSGGLELRAPDTAATPTDAVGPSTGFHVGAGLPVVAGAPTAQYAWVRAEVAGQAVDTRSNRADFLLVSTTGAVVGGVQSMLGSPSPTGRTDPFQHNADLRSSLIDATASGTAAPNRLYTPGTPGRLVLRRTFTNVSDATITRAKVRVTALSEADGAPRPGGVAPPARRANLRLVSPTVASQVITLPGSGTTTVHNLSVDEPSAPAPGGGLNSTLTLPLGGGLAPGASISFAITFDVDTRGTFWFGYDIDAVSSTPVVDRVSRRGVSPKTVQQSRERVRDSSGRGEATGRLR